MTVEQFNKLEISRRHLHSNRRWVSTLTITYYKTASGAARHLYFAYIRVGDTGDPLEWEMRSRHVRRGGAILCTYDFYRFPAIRS